MVKRMKCRKPREREGQLEKRPSLGQSNVFIECVGSANGPLGIFKTALDPKRGAPKMAPRDCMTKYREAVKTQVCSRFKEISCYAFCLGYLKRLRMHFRTVMNFWNLKNKIQRIEIKTLGC